jgi:hypothetical protein
MRKNLTFVPKTFFTFPNRAGQQCVTTSLFPFHTGQGQPLRRNLTLTSSTLDRARGGCTGLRRKLTFACGTGFL